MLKKFSILMTLFGSFASGMDNNNSQNDDEPEQKKIKSESTIVPVPPALPWPLIFESNPAPTTAPAQDNKTEQPSFIIITDRRRRRGIITKVNESLFEALETGKPVNEIREIVAQGADFTVLRGLIGGQLFEKETSTGTTELNAKPVPVLGDTPLITATRYGRIEACDFLLQSGASVNQANADKDTPLHIASNARNDDIAALLIKNRANINERDAKGCTPLHDAACFAGRGLCTLLIENRADLHAADKDGNKPLHLAADCENLQACGALLDHKADVNATNDKGNTALYMDYNYINVWRFLVERGANINSKNKFYNVTPLHRLVEIPENWEVGCSFDDEHCEFIKDFIHMGADHRAKTVAGDTPLHWAIHDPDLCTSLLEAGADVHATNNTGETPLHSATQSNWQRVAEVCEVLITHGAKVNATDINGETPLHTAIGESISNYEDAGPLMVLLQHGAYACIIPEVIQNQSAKARILTALCTLKLLRERYRLPRDVSFLILTSVSDLRNDLLCFLLPYIQRYAWGNNLEQALQKIPVQFHPFIIDVIYHYTMHKLKMALIQLKIDYYHRHDKYKKTVGITIEELKFLPLPSADVDGVEEQFGNMIYSGIAQELGAKSKRALELISQ